MFQFLAQHVVIEPITIGQYIANTTNLLLTYIIEQLLYGIPYAIHVKLIYSDKAESLCCS